MMSLFIQIVHETWLYSDFLLICLADGCEPYCILGLDEPPQIYTTSPVKNTGNPFFDELFILSVIYVAYAVITGDSL